MSLFTKVFGLRQRAATASSIAVVTLAAMTSLAAAQDAGPYAKLYGGLQSIEGMSFADPATADLDLDGGRGLTLGGTLGYGFGNGFRTAFDVSYGEADLDGTFQENVQVFVPCGELSGSPCLNGTVDGDYSSLSGFAMAYYDFATGSALTPYIGVGVGLMDANLEATTLGTLNVGTTSEFELVDGSDSEFGTRVAAGFAYDAGAFDLTADYSWTRSGRLDLAGQGAYTTFNFDKRVNAHTFTVGTRLKF
ncbi:MAG: outer membrane beta-barrel protein [Rhodospirillaceae bacterium]